MASRGVGHINIEISQQSLRNGENVKTATFDWWPVEVRVGGERMLRKISNSVDYVAPVAVNSRHALREKSSISSISSIDEESHRGRTQRWVFRAIPPLRRLP